ncbi:MAG: SDR family oxidoreductase [Pseudomonadota bacterium]
MQRPLTHQIAIVTGANRGIGRQISIDLAAAGANVMLCARNIDSLLPVEEQIESAGGQCTRFKMDVTSEAQVKAAVDEVIGVHGKIDLLVNNAGIGAGSENPWDLPVDEWWAVHEVNVKGTYLCTQTVIRHMVQRGAGRIVDVGSLVGTYPNPSATPYSSSKAALLRWNSCLAEGARRYGVSVFAISPGLVATDMTDQPQFADIPADRWVPIEKSGSLVVALASGRADVLAGRFIHALDDLDALVANVDQIIAENLQTVSMRLLNNLP